jgi:RNA polymerase sigma-32 factor
MANSKGIVSLPASGGEAGLNRYLAEIKKFPILSPEEEYMLAKRWREHGDTEAAAKRADLRGQYRPDAGREEVRA